MTRSIAIETPATIWRRVTWATIAGLSLGSGFAGARVVRWGLSSDALGFGEGSTPWTGPLPLVAVVSTAALTALLLSIALARDFPVLLVMVTGAPLAAIVNGGVCFAAHVGGSIDTLEHLYFLVLASLYGGFVSVPAGLAFAVGMAPGTIACAVLRACPSRLSVPLATLAASGAAVVGASIGRGAGDPLRVVCDAASIGAAAIAAIALTIVAYRVHESLLVRRGLLRGHRIVAGDASELVALDLPGHHVLLRTVEIGDGPYRASTEIPIAAVRVRS